MLHGSVADLDPRSGAFLTPGSGIRIRDPVWKKIHSQDPGSEINIPDFIFENLVSAFWVKNTKFFEADPDPGSGQPWIRDGKNLIRNKYVPDPQHCREAFNIP